MSASGGELWCASSSRLHVVNSRAVKSAGARRARSSAAMSSDGAKLLRAAAAGDDAKVKRLLKAKVDANSKMAPAEFGCTIALLMKSNIFDVDPTATSTARGCC